MRSLMLARRAAYVWVLGVVSAMGSVVQDYMRPGCVTAAKIRRGDAQGGSQRKRFGPLLWGEPVHEARQRFLLAKERVPAWGGTVPAPVCP